LFTLKVDSSSLTRYINLANVVVVGYLSELTLVAQIVLSAVFLLSSVAKAKSSHESLTQAVQRYSFGLLGARTAGSVARLLPLIEFGLAVCLLAGIEIKALSLITTGLLITLTLLMAVHVTRGHRFKCNCFGSEGSEIGIGTLLRNLALVVLSLLLAGLSWLMPYTPSQPSTISEVASLLTITVSLCAILLTLGDIGVLFHTLKPV
jgi:uncharacterized membrane protein